MTCIDFETYLYHRPHLDWDNLSETLVQVNTLFDHLLSDMDSFYALVERAIYCPVRSKLHESDDIRTRLVLYDQEQGNFRLRLHFWHSPSPQIIHTHRFDYVARVLIGSYAHEIYSCTDDLFPSELAYAPENRVHISELPQQLTDLMARISKVYAHQVDIGQSYAQSHNGILSLTIPEVDTVSLFIRGPARTPRAFQWDPDLETVIWRRGAQDLTVEERAPVMLPRDEALQHLTRLRELCVRQGLSVDGN